MDRKELRKLIPRGYCTVIAQKAGVSVHAVSQYIGGQTNSHRIEVAMLEVLGELKKKREALLKKI